MDTLPLGHSLRLPAETLSEIFSYLVPTQIIQPVPDAGLRLFDWSVARPLAAVCRAWRVTAINFQPLWSYVQPHRVPPAVFSELFQRTGTSSLAIFLDLSQVPLEILHIISAESGRIKIFSARVGEDIYAPNHLRTLGHVFQSPASVLEELYVFQDEVFDITGPDGAFILPTLFANVHPSLRVVFLDAISGWNSTFQGLTKLTVMRVDINGAGNTFLPILDILRTSPQLRRLTLDNGLSGRSDLDSDIIWLNSMEHLDIQDNAPEYFRALLSKIALPPTTFVELSQPVYESDLAEAPPFSGLLPETNDAFKLAPFEEVIMLYISMGSHLTGWTEDGGKLVEISVSDCTYHCWGAAGFFDYGAESVLAPFPTAQLKTLVLRADLKEMSLYSTAAWRRVLESMQSLTTLAFEEDVGNVVMALLAPRPDDSLICPVLQRIIIRNREISMEALASIRLLIKARRFLDPPVSQLIIFWPEPEEDSMVSEDSIVEGAGGERKIVSTACIPEVLSSESITVDVRVSLCEQDADGKYWWENGYNGKTMGKSNS